MILGHRAKNIRAAGRVCSGSVARDSRHHLRVCAVIQSFRPTVGGAELQLERLLPHFEARGVSVTVLTRGVRGATRRERFAGAEIRRGLVGGRSSLASASYTLGSLAHLALRRGRYDVVHAHGALSEGTIALGGTLLGLPALVKVLLAGSEGDFDVLEERVAGRWRRRALVRRVWFAATSAAVRAELERLGVRAERVFAIPNGVDVGLYRPAPPPERAQLRRHLELPADGPLAVSVGRLVPRKQIATAIRAIRIAPLGLVVVGDGPERRALERLAYEHGVRERVHFAGEVPNVSEYLRACDCFLLPSRSEGLSNALLEAMACGLVCLAAPVAGVRELFDGGRGVVVSSTEPEAWARALEVVDVDRERAQQLGTAARQLICEEFTLERTADRLVDAYRAMIETRRPR
jgi:glycosyltransferase involved in cell wall biosynthesis